MSGCDLKGMGVLVTRPEHQAQELCAQITAAGGIPISFPCLDILPSRDAAAALQAILQAKDYLIFISQNAVEFALRLLGDTPLPPSARRAAVGQATASALRRAGYDIQLIPQVSFDSEGLLALPELQQLEGKQVVIVRGEGGRPLLGDSLQARGAEVCYAEVYRRALPQVDPQPLISRWPEDVDLVTATSNEVLENLLRLLGGAAQPLLHETPLLVISERMQAQARQLGFAQILLAQNAGSEAILDTLCQWQTDRENG